MKKNITSLVKILSVFILSLFLFYCIPDIPLEVYLIFFDAIVLVICIAYLQPQNAGHMKQVMGLGIVNGLAYVVMHIMVYPDSSWLLNWRQIILGIVAIVELAGIFLVCVFAKKMHIYSHKRQQKKLEESQQNESENIGGEAAEMFPEREDDFKRIETYLDKVNVVGINGCWGSGKSFLMDKFCEKYKENYEIIKVELLTCNQDDIDVFLFQELESVLKKHRIFPTFSRQLQSIMAENSWLKQLQHLFFSGREDRAFAFDGFCKDLQKLNKPVMLIYEDIDRITDVTTIKKIFDLSDRLSSYDLRIVYEFDQENMDSLELNRRYLEKYIPYIVNLTEIPIQRLLEIFFEELNMENVGMKKEDFHFLYLPVYIDPFLRSTLGISEEYTIEAHNLPARKMKCFLEELKIAMEISEFSDKSNRKTVIVFYFIKHFFYELYQKMEFKEDFVQEIRFHDQKEDHQKDYTLMELLTQRKLYDSTNGSMGVSQEETAAMFMETKESETVEENRIKLCLILLFGYRLQFMYNEMEKEISMENLKNGKDVGRLRVEQNRTVSSHEIEQYYHNAKISRIIKNLHANGKSEYTNAEAVAEKFIAAVLNKTGEEQQQGWSVFQADLHTGKICKDNRTIFRIGVDPYLELTKALHLYLEKPVHKKSREEIENDWLSFLDFYFKQDPFKGKIGREFLACCNYCSLASRRVFLKIVEKFSSLEIVGNLNNEKVYMNFLKTYYENACILGYFKSFDSWRLEFPEADEKYIPYIQSFLKDCKRVLKKDIESKQFPSVVIRELQIVERFIQKNLELIAVPQGIKKEEFHFDSQVKTCWSYQDEDTYKRLEKEKTCSYEKFLAALEEAYQNGKISLQEMRRLIDGRDK